MSFFDQFPVQALNHLELLAQQVVEGFIIGLHRSPFHGFSVEFAEHRLYNQGESTKDMDWKVYARTDKLFVKKYEEETNLRCQIVLDVSSSMYFPQESLSTGLVLNKLKFSCLGAACLMNVLKKQRDAFGLSCFDETVREHTLCKSSTTHYKLLLSHLDQYIQNEILNRKTSSIAALHDIAERIHKRSLVIIFSDLFEDQSRLNDIFEAVHHLKHNKHEVILFHVMDRKKELEFDFDNRPYEFVDMESGEKIKLQSNQIKEVYSKSMSDFQNQIQSKCIQYRVDYIPADIHQGYEYVLQSFFVKRKKMII